MVPLEVSLSRMRKEPCVLPDARSCRSASLRLMFLKNHLGTWDRVRAGGELGPPSPTGTSGDAPGTFPCPGTTPAQARLLLNPYSRLGLQAVHHGHEVVGDQTLLASGERLRLPPLPAPARTQRGETHPPRLPGPHTDAPGSTGEPWGHTGVGAGTPSALAHSSRMRSFSPFRSPRSPSCLGS